MNRLTLIFNEQSIRDLEEIWLYTFHTWSIEQADRYHSLMIKEIDFLATNPLSGKKQDHLRKGYRSTKVKSHIIFYKVSETELEVVRILHENMDIPNRLDD